MIQIRLLHRRPLRSIALFAIALVGITRSPAFAGPKSQHSRRSSFPGLSSTSHQVQRAAANGASCSVSGETPAALFERLFSADRRPVVLYDGVCNMCNAAVDVAIEKDPGGERLRFAALQSRIGRGLLVHCGREANDISSMMVVTPDQCLVGSDAPIFVGKQLEGSALLKGASGLADSLVPKVVRELAYNALAANRYSVMGKREELRVGDKEAIRASRFIPDGGAIAT